MLIFFSDRFTIHKVTAIQIYIYIYTIEAEKTIPLDIYHWREKALN